MRIVVRLFAGGDSEKNDENRPDFVLHGYAKGVLMGGHDVAADEKAPKFILTASRASDGANLDWNQIIKGWVGEGGVAREKIYEAV